MRKILIIIVIILVVAAMGIGVYFAWKQSQAILNPPTVGQVPVVPNQKFQQIQNNPTSQQAISQSVLRSISSDQVFDYWVSNASSSPQIYYLNQDGKILLAGTAQSGASDQVVSASTTYEVQAVKASPDGKFAVIKSGDLANPRFSLWSAITKTSTILPNAQAAAFAPDSKKLAMLRRSSNPSSSNLVIKNLLNAKAKDQFVLSIALSDIDLSWIAPQQILLLSKPSFDYTGGTWSVDLKTNKLSLINSGRGIMANWSTDGKYGMLFSVNDDRSTALNLIQPNGGITANLDFATLPSKCFLAPTQMYCALPQSYNTTGGAVVLPDDYLKRAVYSIDFIYSIDLNQNNFTALFADRSPQVDATHLQLAGNQLLFINRYDNKLYSLTINR